MTSRIIKIFSLIIFIQAPRTYSNCNELLGSIVIVGPYSSGKHLPGEVRKLGYRPIAVVPPLDPPGFSFVPADFDRIVVFRGNENVTVQEILSGGGSVRAIIPGSEWNPVVADRLRHELSQGGVPTIGNGLENALARKDKVKFGEALDKAKIPTLQQFSSSNLEEILEWVRHHGKWPVVVKPPKDAGSRNVRFCYSENDVRDAFSKILTGSPNSKFEIDDVVIVEEKLNGPEFAINGIRSGGRTILSGIWHYERIERGGAATIYVADRLTDSHGVIQDKLAARASQVLYAIGLNEGPFHLEFIVTDDRGPLAIDVGARLSGGSLPELERVSTDRDPFRMTVEAYVSPASLSGMTPRYTRIQYAAVVFVSSDGKGTRASHTLAPTLDRMKQSGQIVDYSFNFPEGIPLPRTVDSPTTVANIQIVGGTKEEVDRQIQQILEWQEQGLFEMRVKE